MEGEQSELFTAEWENAGAHTKSGKLDFGFGKRRRESAFKGWAVQHHADAEKEATEILTEQ